MTLVSAGPGYGKTLTLASWSRLGAAAGPVAWLTVDESDNDLQAFWSDLLGALTLGAAVPADSALREVMPAAGFGVPEARLVRAGVADLPDVVVLVLDDFHHITDHRVLESFGLLLDHQPPQLRLMLATRAEPALRLHRSRVNGDLTDIRARDLAFTAPEAAELFGRNGIALSGSQLTVLLERTRGWTAGLQLALMCLDPNDIDGGMSRFTGTEPMVAEYLIEEVTDQLPEPDRQFLLTTSVADRLSAELANALTGRSDGQLTLERLAAQNALLVALAGRSDWFSVHPLLRELLLNRLARDQPGAVVDLHLRAAQWFAAHADAQLIASEPRAAIDVLDDSPDPSGFTAALQQVVLAKARLMLDQPDATLELLDTAAPPSLTYRGPAVEARILTAVAAGRMHRDTAALAAITRAIDLAQGVGMIRPFLAAGPQITPL
ncbi:MAG TPA: hypothetical protein VFC16_03150, partial [Nakamurella sp.]|nr:hypothetical protein [Nakamurella sp.]